MPGSRPVRRRRFPGSEGRSRSAAVSRRCRWPRRAHRTPRRGPGRRCSSAGAPGSAGRILGDGRPPGGAARMAPGTRGPDGPCPSREAMAGCPRHRERAPRCRSRWNRRSGRYHDDRAPSTGRPSGMTLTPGAGLRVRPGPSLMAVPSEKAQACTMEPDTTHNEPPEPVLWQNLFWFFGHPEVYILALPYFGMVTDILPVFSRKPLFGYKGMVFATMSIAALSTGVWAHHMFTTGVVLLPFFSLLSYLIAVPTGIKFFNWIGTMWGGQLSFQTPMLFSVGFLFAFLMGGVTGVLLASPPVDFMTHNTYFVVAHFHQVLIGTTVFAGFAGFYFWYPKMFGRMLNERLGKLHFWTMFIGFWITFIPQYLLGLDGMPRRIADYLPSNGWTTLNVVSTVGAFILGASFLFFFANLWVSWRSPVAAGDNPWDGGGLEWFTSSPPPHHNFTHLPPIRSERPVWDYNHPEHRKAHRPGADPVPDKETVHAGADS